MIGLGFNTIFQSSIVYLLDSFTRYSASALAAMTFVRSVLAGAFPLFMQIMCNNIGVNWSMTIFGCIAALLTPVPFLFFIWGKQIRVRGEWSKLSA